MFRDSESFSSFSTSDVEAAREFYGNVLGLDVETGDMGLGIRLGGGTRVFVYPKPNHEPASFTVLNFFVSDLAAAIDHLASAGVTMERYPGMEQDERGISRAMGGPPIAWFTDPAGNVISMLEGSMPDSIASSPQQNS